MWTLVLRSPGMRSGVELVIMHCVRGIKDRSFLQVVFASCAVLVQCEKNPTLDSSFLKLIVAGSKPIGSGQGMKPPTIYWFLTGADEI